jgi:hypothetical protein
MPALEKQVKVATAPALEQDPHYAVAVRVPLQGPILKEVVVLFNVSHPMMRTHEHRNLARAHGSAVQLALLHCS